jgi:hypothetical protein
VQELSIYSEINVPVDVRAANVVAAAARDLPWIEEGAIRNRPVVICGGGPSLARSLDVVFNPGADVWALNGTHDWLIERGWAPEAHVLLDARPENVCFVKHPRDDVRYYVASQCAPEVFDALSGGDVILWHTGEVADMRLSRVKSDTPLISAGPTVGLKAIALAHTLGYREIHLCGYDSSYERAAGHAYAQPLNNGEEVIQVYCGDEMFWAAPWMAHQVHWFADVALAVQNGGGELFVHGTGLLPAYARRLTEAAGGRG